MYDHFQFPCHCTWAAVIRPSVVYFLSVCPNNGMVANIWNVNVHTDVNRESVAQDKSICSQKPKYNQVWSPNG